ncbi:MAG TPA: DUF892 family protein [Candidatus Angelobacter sp.]|nr:DUF892 family protein [Candidatus Angelobacter sp.]
MKVQSLRALYLDQLKDLYDAEHQLLRALSRMAEAASSGGLRTVLADHLEKTRRHARRLEIIFVRLGDWSQSEKAGTHAAGQRLNHHEIADMVAKELRIALADPLEKTKEHARRLEMIFEQMGQWAQGKKGQAWEGPAPKSGESRKEGAEGVKDGITDAILIAAAQRVEHYEVAGYRCARTYATLLGDKDAAALLALTFHEKEKASEALNGIATQLNLEVREIAVDPKCARPRRPANSRWQGSVQELDLKVS